MENEKPKQANQEEDARNRVQRLMDEDAARNAHLYSPDDFRDSTPEELKEVLFPDGYPPPSKPLGPLFVTILVCFVLFFGFVFRKESGLCGVT